MTGGEVLVGPLGAALDHLVDDFAPLILRAAIREDALRVVTGAADPCKGGEVPVVGLAGRGGSRCGG